MQYDFTSIIARQGRDAVAVDDIVTGAGGNAPTAPKEGFDIIPMWIADMNFPTLPAIQQSIIARVQDPHFGYFSPRKEYYDAIIRWQTERNGASGLEARHIGYENGVLGGVVSAANVLCSRGDKILIHSPTYVGFTHSLEDNGYRLVHSPLVRDGEGVWRMDFEDMERKLSEQQIHTAVFCSPHNPTGRVWERWEVEKFMELCKKYSVYVISDEIWSDIIRPGLWHIPTQSVSQDARERTVAMYAPSKTFSLAGLVGSYHIIYNDWIRHRVEKESSLSQYNTMNLLSMYALIGAYGPEGRVWADELCQVIAGNVDYARSYIAQHFKGVEAVEPQGTYMLFLDCSKWCEDHGKTIDDVKQAGWDVGVGWQDGRPFHGSCHLRVNLALPLSRVKEAMERMDRYVFNA